MRSVLDTFINLGDRIFLRKYHPTDSEVYFQASVLMVLHIAISIFLSSILFVSASERLIDILILGIVGLSLTMLVLLKFGYLTLATTLSYTGMGAMATAIAFSTEVFHSFEAYMLCASHMFIILVSSLITQQRRYTIYTTFLATIYLLIHMIFRAIPIGGPVGAFDVDDYIVSALLIVLTGFIVNKSVQRRIELLHLAQHESQQHEEKGRELAQNLHEKEILLNEIHHRVKNNLNVAISLLRMQMERSSSTPEAVTALSDSINRLYSMALVHERLYKAGNFSAIEFKPYITSILHSILRSQMSAKVLFNIDVADGLSIELNRAVPCGLILNELITNVYKHAYDPGQAGNASVMMDKNGAEFVLVVQDEGRGVDPENWTNSSSLGVKVITLLTEQLEGQLEVKNHQGTRIQITFPVTPS